MTDEIHTETHPETHPEPAELATALELPLTDADGRIRIFKRTDLGNAERFMAQHGEDVRYLPAWKKWMIWDGKRWRIDDTLAVVRMAKATVRSMYKAAPRLAKATQRAELVMHATKSEAEARITAMLRLAGAECAITPEHLDRDPWLLACDNGTIDLRSGKLLAHRRSDLITKLSPASYDLEAECPRWLDFLHTVTAGDQDLINFLQRAIGYSLTGITSERVLFFLYGHGRNGKSKFLEVLRALLAGYAAQADSSTFLERKSDGPRNDIARLFGSRLVTSSEIGEGKRLNEALVKALVGDEVISARFLFSEDFEFKPGFKVWVAANHRPVVRGTDKGIWDRIRMVPFTVRIADDQVDPDLFEKLTAELPGILAWAVGGCVLWQVHGLGWARAVRLATDQYRADSDVLGAFLEDRCELAEGHEQAAGVLYQGYVRWCQQTGEHAITMSAFGSALQERGIHVIKRGGAKLRIGVKLLDDAGGPAGGAAGSAGGATGHASSADAAGPDRPGASETDEAAIPRLPGLDL